MKKLRVFLILQLLLLLSIIFSVHTSQAAQDFYVTGMVISGASRTPISSIWVTAYQNGARRGRSLTGNDGRYYIGGLDGGKYDIVVIRGQQELFRKQIQLPEDTKLDIVL